jgi:hypothetical protein
MNKKINTFENFEKNKNTNENTYENSLIPKYKYVINDEEVEKKYNVFLSWLSLQIKNKKKEIENYNNVTGIIPNKIDDIYTDNIFNNDIIYYLKKRNIKLLKHINYNIWSHEAD